MNWKVVDIVRSVLVVLLVVGAIVLGFAAAAWRPWMPYGGETLRLTMYLMQWSTIMVLVALVIKK